MKTTLSATALFLLILAIIGWAILWPLALIWALNAIFGLGLAYSFLNWLAILIITGIARSVVTVTVNK